MCLLLFRAVVGLGRAPETEQQVGGHERGRIIVCGLGDDAVRALLRLFELYMTDICVGATPLVVDVRREKIHRPTRRPMKRGFDKWMENEASSLAGLWELLAAA